MKKQEKNEIDVQQVLLAHIREDGAEQTLEEHLQGTARLAEQFANAFQAGDFGRQAGGIHDHGKSSREFQNRLRGDSKPVNHSDAGAQMLFQKGSDISAICVAGHHSGLPNWGAGADPAGASTFQGRMKRRDLPACLPKPQLPLELTPPPLPESYRGPMNRLEKSFFIRMLYSCLTDADFLDTERFMQGDSVLRQPGDSIPVLNQKLDRYLEEQGFLKPGKEINQKRAAILRQCLEGGSQAPGLFSLTVPTGGGKTVSSLAFALRHAAAYGKKRVIYVIPYCSIIDQTAGKFREILGSENVLEHHSGVIYEKEGGSEQDWEDSCKHPMALATENWDKPVIVTTMVQFFESLYAARSSRCRKLHNIANSVVVFDEAQMMPVQHLRPCVMAIAQLVQHFSVTAVLCTATQPSLNRMFQEMAPDWKIRELCADTLSLYRSFRRVTFQMEPVPLSCLELAGRLMEHHQVLCIVNTRKAAQRVYQQLSGEGNYHLSTYLYPAQRQKLIQEIRDRLAEGLPCRVVSTSLIEAGVDVDFPAVYREQAGLDSILQAAGRCNREGGHSPEESIVTVFTLEDVGDNKSIQPNLEAFRQVAADSDELEHPDTIRWYFNLLFYQVGEDALDQEGILKLSRSKKLPFREMEQKFHLIDENTKTVYIPLEEGEELVERLRGGEVNRNLFRQLGRYGVSVYPYQFQALYQAGDIELLTENAAILVNLSLYHRETGLSPQAEEGKGIFG